MYKVDSCHDGNQPLFFIKCSCLRFWGPDEKEPPEHQVPPRPQKWPKLAIKHQNNPKKALSAPAGDQTAVILAINHSVFIKWSYLRFLRSKKVCLDHTMAPRPQKCPNVCRQTWKVTQNYTLCSGWGPRSCYIGNWALCFHWMILTKGFRIEEGVSRSQSCSQVTKMA